jgi:hypothetical protein
MDDEYSKYGNLIMDARRLFRGFRSWNITHVRRESNMVAHSFAKFAVSLEQTRVWFELYLTCLSGVVLSAFQ